MNEWDAFYSDPRIKDLDSATRKKVASTYFDDTYAKDPRLADEALRNNVKEQFLQAAPQEPPAKSPNIVQNLVRSTIQAGVVQPLRNFQDLGGLHKSKQAEREASDIAHPVNPGVSSFVGSVLGGSAPIATALGVTMASGPAAPAVGPVAMGLAALYVAAQSAGYGRGQVAEYETKTGTEVSAGTEAVIASSFAGVSALLTYGGLKFDQMALKKLFNTTSTDVIATMIAKKEYRRLAGAIVATGAMEGAENTAQTATENALTKGLYDIERNVTADLPMAFATGAAGGMVIGPIGAMGARKGQAKQAVSTVHYEFDGVKDLPPRESFTVEEEAQMDPDYIRKAGPQTITLDDNTIITLSPFGPTGVRIQGLVNEGEGGQRTVTFPPLNEDPTLADVRAALMPMNASGRWRRTKQEADEFIAGVKEKLAQERKDGVKSTNPELPTEKVRTGLKSKMKVATNLKDVPITLVSNVEAAPVYNKPKSQIASAIAYIQRNFTEFGAFLDKVEMIPDKNWEADGMDPQASGSFDTTTGKILIRISPKKHVIDYLATLVHEAGHAKDLKAELPASETLSANRAADVVQHFDENAGNPTRLYQRPEEQKTGNAIPLSRVQQQIDYARKAGVPVEGGYYLHEGLLTDAEGNRVLAYYEPSTDSIHLSRDANLDTVGHELFEHFYSKIDASDPLVQKGIALFGDKEALADAVGLYYAGKVESVSLRAKIEGWLSEFWASIKNAAGRDLTADELVAVINKKMVKPANYENAVQTHLRMFDTLGMMKTNVNLSQLPLKGLSGEEQGFVRGVAEDLKASGKKVVSPAEFKQALNDAMIPLTVELDVRDTEWGMKSTVTTVGNGADPREFGVAKARRYTFETPINFGEKAHSGISSKTAAGWFEAGALDSDSSTLRVFEVQPSDAVKDYASFIKHSAETPEQMQRANEAFFKSGFNEQDNSLRRATPNINSHFYRAIIQWAAKNGYKKVQFPVGKSVEVIEGVPDDSRIQLMYKGQEAGLFNGKVMANGAEKKILGTYTEDVENQIMAAFDAAQSRNTPVHESLKKLGFDIKTVNENGTVQLYNMLAKRMEKEYPGQTSRIDAEGNSYPGKFEGYDISFSESKEKFILKFDNESPETNRIAKRDTKLSLFEQAKVLGIRVTSESPLNNKPFLEVSLSPKDANTPVRLFQHKKFEAPESRLQQPTEEGKKRIQGTWGPPRVGEEGTPRTEGSPQSEGARLPRTPRPESAGVKNVTRLSLTNVEKGVYEAVLQDFNKPHTTLDAEAQKAKIVLDDPEWINTVIDAAYNGRAIHPHEGLALHMLMTKMTQHLVAEGHYGKMPLGDLEALKDAYHRVVFAGNRDASKTGLHLSLLRRTNEEHMQKKLMLLEEPLRPDQANYINSLDWDDPVSARKMDEYMETPKIRDYLGSVWYNSMLSGVPTHLVNFTSNTVWFASMFPHRVVTAGADAFLSVMQNRERRVFMREVFPMLTGAKKGLKPGLKAAKEVMQHGFTISSDLHSKFEQDMGGSMTAFERSPITKFREFAPVMTFFTRAMRAADILAKSMAIDAELQALAYRSGRMKGYADGSAQMENHINYTLSHVTPEMKELAKRFGDYSTFNDATGRLTNAVMDARNSVPGGMLVVPFVKTISNLLKRGMEFVPALGAGVQYRGGFKVSKVRGKNGKMTTLREKTNANLGAEIIARQLEGALITATIIGMFNDAQLTGAVPSDPAERDAFFREGKLPYALKMGGKWYSYQRMEPLNTLISTIATVRNSLLEAKDGEAAFNTFAKGVQEVAMTYVNNSYVSNLVNLTEQSGFVRWANRLPSTFIPYSSMMRTISVALQNDNSSVVVPAERTMWGEVSNTIFLTSYEGKTNALGEEVRIQGNTWEQWWPYKSSVETSDPAEIEMARLNKSGVGRIYPSKPDKFLTVGGRPVELPNDLYKQYAVEYGRATKEAILKVIQTSGYQRANDERKIQMMHTQMERYRTRIRRRVLSDLMKGQRLYTVPPRKQGL